MQIRTIVRICVVERIKNTSQENYFLDVAKRHNCLAIRDFIYLCIIFKIHIKSFHQRQIKVK